jgi:hypothetical protein
VKQYEDKSVEQKAIAKLVENVSNAEGNRTGAIE